MVMKNEETDRANNRSAAFRWSHSQTFEHVESYSDVSENGDGNMKQHQNTRLISVATRPWIGDPSMSLNSGNGRDPRIMEMK